VTVEQIRPSHNQLLYDPGRTPGRRSPPGTMPVADGNHPQRHHRPGGHRGGGGSVESAPGHAGRTVGRGEQRFVRVRGAERFQPGLSDPGKVPGRELYGTDRSPGGGSGTDRLHRLRHYLRLVSRVRFGAQFLRETGAKSPPDREDLRDHQPDRSTPGDHRPWAPRVHSGRSYRHQLRVRHGAQHPDPPPPDTDRKSERLSDPIPAQTRRDPPGLVIRCAL
jgi:hypothetical protein